MKKLLVSLMAIVMVLSMAACGETKPADTTAAAGNTTTAAPDDTTGAAASDSFGAMILNEFRDLVSSSSDKSPMALANGIANGGKLPFEPVVMEVEPGLLAGFDNYEVTGFEKGVTFGPMIGSIPFVAYVFELSEGTDVNAFTEGLKEHANLRWNICVEADEIVSEAEGNIVFFMMCPDSVEG